MAAMRDIVCLIGLIVFSSIGLGQTKRPNVVLFLVDDLGWQDSSVPMGSEPSALNQRYRTPNLEKLAKRSVRFSNAYASAPVCTPTRTAILTGRTPARTHITYWTLNKDHDQSVKRADIKAPAWQVNGLQPGRYELLPEVLRQVGFRTIHVGKAHFGVHKTPGADPKQLGFEVNIAGHASGAPGSYYGTDHFTGAGRRGNPPHEKPGVWDVPGMDKYHGHNIYLTDALAIEACGAIRDSVADGKPFYLNFAPYAVHTPIMGNKKYEGNYAELDPAERAYASMIESYDAALGALITTLEETGQLDNTILIFSSDNGGLSAHARGAAPDGKTKHTHNAPLRSGKGSAYEGGTRVPTLICWPGVTDQDKNAGRVIDQPIISHDFYPTILTLVGLQTDLGPEVDGRELSALMTGREGMFDTTRVLGWHQPHQWGVKGPGIEPFTSIRQRDWKLIYFHGDLRKELYNLATDPGEAQDLAAQQPERVKALAKVMQGWIENTGAQMSIDIATGKPVAGPGQ